MLIKAIYAFAIITPIFGAVLMINTQNEQKSIETIRIQLIERDQNKIEKLLEECYEKRLIEICEREVNKDYEDAAKIIYKRKS